jgi:outer membrane protein assembly factor BamD
MRFFFVKLITLIFLAASLQGCEGLRYLVYGDETEAERASKDECDEWKDTEDDDKDCVDWDAAKFRRNAKKAMDGGNYQKAIKIYEALESRYPFGPDSSQTQLDIAYAYYKNSDPEAALAAADRFIKVNPRSPNVDYAYYLKGLVNYNRDISFTQRFLPTDASQRDPGSARNAYDIFDELVRKYPSSKYVPDSRKRMVALKNNLAMHEVHVARYYMKRRAYVAAANRAAYVVEKYQRTTAVPYALQVMQEAYTKLDMPEQAKNAENTYKLNFPNGPPVPEYENATISHKIWDFIGLEK